MCWAGHFEAAQYYFKYFMKTIHKNSFKFQSPNHPYRLSIFAILSLLFHCQILPLALHSHSSDSTTHSSHHTAPLTHHTAPPTHYTAPPTLYTPPLTHSSYPTTHFSHPQLTHSTHHNPLPTSHPHKSSGRGLLSMWVTLQGSSRTQRLSKNGLVCPMWEKTKRDEHSDICSISRRKTTAFSTLS